MRHFLLAGLLLGAALADRAAAPLPLHDTPALSGPPRLTLPPGTLLAPLNEPLRGGVVALPHGDRVYFARAGLVGREWQLPRARQQPRPALVFVPAGPFAYLGHPPFPLGRDVTLTLSRGEDPAERARVPRDWVLRVLPLPPSEAGRDLARFRSGPAVLTRAVSAPGKDRAVNLGRLAPGRYLLTASRPGGAAVWAAAAFEVTDLSLLAAATPDAVQVTALHAVSGAALPGARLTAVAYRRAEVPGQGWEFRPVRALPAQTTDAQGRAVFALRDGESLSLTGRWAQGGATHRAALHLPGQVWVGALGRARAYLVTDKPVYRPGETLRGLALVRGLGAGERPAGARPLILRLRGARGETLGLRRAVTDERGLVRFTFPLPEGVMTGHFSLEAELPALPTPGNPSPSPDTSAVPVQVRAFVRPEFILTLAAPREVVAGEDIPLLLKAERYAGGPAEVAAGLFRQLGYPENHLSPPGSAVRDPADLLTFEGVSARSSQGSAHLGDRAPDLSATVRGAAALRLPWPGSVPGAYPHRSEVVVRATDAYGRPVLASRAVTVHPAAIKFVLPQPPQGSGGRLRGAVLLRAVGSEAPLPGVAVSVQLRREPSGPGQAETVWQGTLTSDAAGRLALDLPLAAGYFTLELRARDAQGRLTRTQTGVGEPQHSAPDRPGFRLVLRRPGPVATVGQTARFALDSDLPPGTPLTVTVGTEGRATQRRAVSTGARTAIDVPVTAALSPGFSVFVDGTFRGQALSAASGVMVPREDRRLRVELGAPAGELRPGGRATLTVRTTLGGRPVPATVLLSAVHEAVYAVAEDPSPEPWRFFWGHTWPQVQLLNSYGPLFDGGRGGGGGGPDTPPRTDLREVAHFGALQTGPDGQARVSFNMPELLGAYRVSARAFGASTSAGEAFGSLRVGLPFAVSLLRPPVLTHGDRGSVALTVSDRTGGDPSSGDPGGGNPGGGNTVRLSLSAGGRDEERTVTLRGGLAQAHVPLLAPPDGRELLLTARARRDTGAHTVQDAVQEALPLRPSGERRRGERQGSGPLREALQTPGGGELRLTVAGSELQARALELRAVLRDPRARWVSTDGVAAALSANLELRALAARLGWSGVAAEVEAAARRDLATLLALRGERGWGWTAHTGAQPDLTAQALAALAAAAAAGLTDAPTLAGAREQARALLAVTPPAGRAELAAALARAGDPAPARALVGQVSDPAALAWLAPALLERDRAAAAAALRTALTAAVRGERGSLRLGGVPQTAALAGAAAALGHPAAPALAQAVWEAQTGGLWPTPAGTAAGVALLRQLLARESPAGGAKAATVRVGGETRTVDLRAPERLSFALRGGETLEIAGPAGLFWRRELRWGAAPAVPGPLRVERRYSTAAPAAGERVTVTLRLTTPRPLARVRLSDPLPGGLEAVDDRPFAEPGRVDTPGGVGSVYAERSFLAGEAVFYLETLPAGTTTLTHELRALAPGEYVAPAPRAASSVGGPLGEGEAERVTVREPQQ